MRSGSWNDAWWSTNQTKVNNYLEATCLSGRSVTPVLSGVCDLFRGKTQSPTNTFNDNSLYLNIVQSRFGHKSLKSGEPCGWYVWGHQYHQGPTFAHPMNSPVCMQSLWARCPVQGGGGKTRRWGSKLRHTPWAGRWWLESRRCLSQIKKAMDESRLEPCMQMDEKRWEPCKWPREQRESWQRWGNFFGELDSAQSRSETFYQLAIALCLMKLYEEAENSASLTHCWLNYHFLSYCDQEWNHCFVHIKWNIAIFTVAQNRK